VRAGRLRVAGLVRARRRGAAQVRETFGLHELAVEDAQNIHMRPKTETYDRDVRLVILRTARYDDTAEDVEFGEISIFLAPTFVITELRPYQRISGRSNLLWVVASVYAVADIFGRLRATRGGADE
jgi:Mg2+ and Co2+ transporter CorA